MSDDTIDPREALIMHRADAALDVQQRAGDLVARLTDTGADVVRMAAGLANEREQAREMAVALEQEVAEAREVIAGLLTHSGLQASSWAVDTAAVERARAFMEGPDD